MAVWVGYSVVGDITNMNAGRLTGIHKRLSNFMMTLGHGIHSLECILPVNEIFLHRVPDKVEEKSRVPKTMQVR